MAPTLPNHSITRREYHATRRLHGAHIEDRFEAAARRLDDQYADRRSSLTDSGYSAVSRALSGLSHELRTLLTVSRFLPAPSGRLTDCGPRSHALRCELAERMVKRRRALVLADAWTQSVALSARIARENATSMRAAA